MVEFHSVGEAVVACMCICVVITYVRTLLSHVQTLLHSDLFTYIRACVSVVFLFLLIEMCSC